ncbi:MAG: hypothetical protein ACRD29_09215 [Acidimicrobiales bacterium]
MPPTSVHFNGGVNLADAETVMREIAARVPVGVRRIPDGETGDRQQWIFFQLQKFWETDGVEPAGTADLPSEGYEAMPKVRLADGVAPEDVAWPSLGYADAYQESFAIFSKLQDEGVIPAGVRFQVEYPTPLASINAWLVDDDQDRLEPSYERALFADLDRLLAALPHDRVAAQWDVAVEFGVLEGGFGGSAHQGFDDIVARLARCVDHVPADVPVGLHLCYGDYKHRHFMEPESLETQVNVANAVTAAAERSVHWFAFTVPQYQRTPAYFEPLRRLEMRPDTELYFALVPYHPEEQEPGTTAAQVALVDEHLPSAEGLRPWGVCTECGMARAEREEIPVLLDLHREILAAHG